MAINIDKSINSPPHPQTYKFFVLTHISFRTLAAVATLAATSIMLINKQTSVVYGITVDARYSYSSAFKFFAYANLIACIFSFLLLVVALVVRTKPVLPTYYYYVFLHDLVIAMLLMAGCAAATAIGYVGKYGNDHTGWMPICDNFGKFCNKVVASIFLSYLGFLFYLILVIVSANKSHQIHV